MTLDSVLTLSFTTTIFTGTEAGFSVSVDGVPVGIIGGVVSESSIFDLTIDAVTTHTSVILLSYNGSGFLLGASGETPLGHFTDRLVTPIP